MVFILKVNLLLSMLGFHPSDDTLSPKLSGYKISDCDFTKFGNSYLSYANLENNELQIRLGAYLNCVVDPHSPLTFELHEDTLNILIPEYKEVVDTVIEKTDSVDKITVRKGVTTIKCDCFFIVYLGIRNCTKIPGVIQLNGVTLKRMDEKRKR